MRSKFTPVYTFFAFLSIGFLFTSLAGGRTNSWANAPGDSGSCKTCHNSSESGIPNGSVDFTGTPASIVEGQTYTFVVELTRPANGIQAPGNLGHRGGFQLTATNGANNTLVGTFLPINEENTKLNNVNRLVQSSPQSFNTDFTIDWQVSWKAPDANLPDDITFYLAGNAADGNGSSGSNDYGYNVTKSISTSAPLAVNFLSFQTTAQSNGDILLEWKVANEKQTNYYEIERSADGEKFATIAMQSVDNQINSYEYTDFFATKNKTFYYRIKEVATDGKIQLSTIQTARVETAATAILAYPNPVFVGQNVQLEIPTDFMGQLQIVNLNGQVVSTKNITGDLDLFNLETTNLVAGTYSVLLKNEIDIYQQKLVILK